jgi:hypothetical protein
MPRYRLEDQQALATLRVAHLKHQLNQAVEATMPAVEESPLLHGQMALYRLLVTQQLDLACAEAEFLDIRAERYRNGIAQG